MSLEHTGNDCVSDCTVCGDVFTRRTQDWSRSQAHQHYSQDHDECFHQLWDNWRMSIWRWYQQMTLSQHLVNRWHVISASSQLTFGHPNIIKAVSCVHCSHFKSSFAYDLHKCIIFICKTYSKYSWKHLFICCNDIINIPHAENTEI